MSSVNGYDKIARFYDIEHDALTDDLFMYESFARRCGSPVLELGCGTGRVALHLAQAGFEVIGLDVSSAMLDLARSKLGRTGLSERVHLFQADLGHFALARQFSMATLAINTFMHFLTVADQVRVLENARRHLQPGGRLVVDLPRADRSLLLEAGEHLAVNQLLTDPDTGQLILKLISATVDLATQTQHLALAYDETDKGGVVHRTTASFQVHFFFRYEMELLLTKAGFDLETLYGSYDLDPYDNDSERMIFVARAPTQDQMQCLYRCGARSAGAGASSGKSRKNPL
ncbi:MAG: class I SAM-dependent methyltransferase [Anaerolineae bacterium]|nr:MAG: class I SAM-dependent methyltransferase [Anaerolineae bacterium]